MNYAEWAMQVLSEAPTQTDFLGQAIVYFISLGLFIYTLAPILLFVFSMCLLSHLKNISHELHSNNELKKEK